MFRREKGVICVLQWQVKFAAEKSQAVLITHSCEDVKPLEGQLMFGEETFAIKNFINILRVKDDSKLKFPPTPGKSCTQSIPAGDTPSLNKAQMLR